MFVVGGLFKLLGDLCGLVGPLSISYIVEFVNLQQTLSNASNFDANSTITIDASGATEGIGMRPNDGNFHNETNASAMINYPDWLQFSANGCRD
jgi:hypothetical protein